LNNRSLLKTDVELGKLPAAEVPAPEIATVFMKQHAGVECMPLVKQGDVVKTGQRIGAARDYLSADVHSPVSGEVARVEKTEDPYGGFTTAVTIKSDGEDERLEILSPDTRVGAMSPVALRALTRTMGVTLSGLEPLPLAAAVDPYGMPAKFLLHIGASIPPAIDTVIVSTVDAEPLSAVNERLLIDRGSESGAGLQLLTRMTGADRVFFAAKRSHTRRARAVLGGSYKDSVTIVPDSYPNTLPQMLVRTLTGRAIPAGATPRDIGVLIVSFCDMVAALDAARDKKPAIFQNITLAGGAAGPPRNLRVRVGTPARDILAFCGCRESSVGKLVFGGPMRGKAQFSLDVPVVRGVDTILALTPGEISHTEGYFCMNCGSCVDVCPVNLQPNLLSRHCEFFQYDDPKFREELSACIECGLCGYVCPSHRPMLQYFQNARHQLGIGRKGSSL